VLLYLFIVNVMRKSCWVSNARPTTRPADIPVNRLLLLMMVVRNDVVNVRVRSFVGRIVQMVHLIIQILLLLVFIVYVMFRMLSRMLRIASSWSFSVQGRRRHLKTLEPNFQLFNGSYYNLYNGMSCLQNQIQL